MLKTLIAALVLTFGTVAAAPAACYVYSDAEAIESTIEQWWDAKYVCRMAALPDGGKVTEAQLDVDCAKRDRLNVAITSEGYTWDGSEQEWVPSPSCAAVTRH